MDQNLISSLWKMIEPILEPEGIELVELQLQMDRGKWVLRLFIDTVGGVKLSDCELVSRQVGALLDIKDPIEHAYTLEVSSPGINRVLRREKDFVAYAGSPVRIRTRQKVGGRKNFRGTLLGCEDSMIVAEVEGARVQIPLEYLESARLDLPESELFRRDLKK